MKNCVHFIIFVSSCLSLLSSCDERETLIFGDQHSIYFDKFFMDAIFPGTEAIDSTSVSFFFLSEDVNETHVRLIVNLSGKKLTDDLEFELRVVEEGTTANPDEYKLESYYKFRARPISEEATVINDTIQIKMLRSERLVNMENGVRLVLELVPNDKVSLGQYERTRANIILLGNALIPDWWTKEVSISLMGPYSPQKYRLFLLYVDKEGTMNGDMIKNRPDLATVLVLKFKKWLSEQDPIVMDKDEFGNEFPMSVAI